MEINEKYYEGYEGDPNMLFCRTENDIPVEKINIWDGYFDFIMSLVQPEEEGWTGLAYFYHLIIGWYEEENWLIPNIAEAYGQLEKLNPEELPYREAKEVLALLLNMLKRAMDTNGKVYIMYDV